MDVFNVYVERVLRPAIRRGDILVLDNLRRITPAASRRWPRNAARKSSVGAQFAGLLAH